MKWRNTAPSMGSASKATSSLALDLALQAAHNKPQKASESPIFSFRSPVRCDFQRANFDMLRSWFVYQTGFEQHPWVASGGLLV